jgi:hypothetical protein
MRQHRLAAEARPGIRTPKSYSITCLPVGTGSTSAAFGTAPIEQPDLDTLPWSQRWTPAQELANQRIDRRFGCRSQAGSDTKLPGRPKESPAQEGPADLLEPFEDSLD